ncbi:uncharacterized protein TOT_020000312 [Theileria orientalis strain Shintoku]|uniref:mRNA (guanine-N(7))-methyltransferase n=1 Tax=Theileria orientalis strain Shintoku TaxID=869250 RepID=J4D795_THEOR|nr:uncharacterized protein TOT_020000312 [Theileria orientalis strain Shintoku]BAM40045.1 uncharacterized protein TOT_020000312 [Theileria orientalis strain Shintoku]|eukprot:XP_009690346.1 uncharacterized protein TOT_020000312 [Theileria orientalis strain Shintoku]
MIPSPKKHRKISQSDSTHTGLLEVTSRENPLLINGYSVLDKQYKENTVHSQICDTIRESLEGISDPSKINVMFQIGRLMSVVQSKSIFLPIENEAVLDYDFNKVKFVPNVSKKCIDLLYLNVFASKSNFSKLVPNFDYLEIEVFHSKSLNGGSFEVKSSGSEEALHNKKLDGINHSTIYRTPFDVNEPLDFSSIESYIYNYLNSVIVYRPQSEYHFKVQTNSITSLKTSSTSNVSKILFRHIRTYRTSKTPNYKLIKFNLEVIDQWDIPVNEELLKLKIEEMMSVFFEAFISSSSSRRYSFLDIENSEESKDKNNEDNKEIEANGSNYESQLCKQYRRLVNSKPNRFEFIITLLSSNTRMLLDLFSNHAGPSQNTARNMGEDALDMSDFYPNLFGDTSEFAQIHYDTRKVVRQQESAIQALRKYNNLVKRLMIMVYIKQNATVLDLACGHGQDIDKYDVKRIKKLMGIDISLREINEARRRYSQRKRVLSYTAEFHHGNLMDSKVYSVFVKNKRFDVVSIQLAIHYILETEAGAEFILRKVHEILNEGGLFIGSTVCCERISQELAMNPPVQGEEKEKSWTFGNPIFKVTMEQKSIEAIKNTQEGENMDRSHIGEVLNSTWGLKYHFFLMESIDEGEYIVPWKAFAEMCTKIGFKLVESLTFPEYLEKSRRLFAKRALELPHNVYENVEKHLGSASNFQLSKEQERAFSLYKIFVFEKMKARDKLYIQGVKIKK